MNQLTIFLVRVLLGAFFAVVLTAFFMPGSTWATRAGIGILLVLLAYVFEFFRNKQKYRN